MDNVDLPKFDELHVISDLHLGGAAGFQIFAQGQRLAATIRSLAMRAATKQALVLNGDIVDYLAEAPASYFDGRNAIAKLRRIAGDPAFSPVFDALTDYVGHSGRILVLVLGNHDVELALPEVRSALVEMIARGSDEARGRIILALDGAGWAARVGSKRVLCVHGNEVDPWNPIDFGKVLNWSRVLNGHVAHPPEMFANAGTRLVIDVMNGVKRQFPVVDLLKPENKASLPVIAALAPVKMNDVLDIAKVAVVRARDKIRLALGWLGDQPDAAAPLPEPTSQEVYQEFLAPVFDAAVSSAGTVDTTSLADSMFDEALGGKSGQSESLRASYLGATSSDEMGAYLGGEPSPKLLEGLRRAMQYWLTNDRTFRVDGPDETFDALAKDLDPAVDVLIAGHTHLRRAKALPGGNGRMYFNSGTWIRLVEIPRPVLASTSAFTRLFGAFSAGSMQALDDYRFTEEEGGGSLVRYEATVVSILATANGWRGGLYEAQDDGALRPVSGGTCQ